jgi:hypothetical protein
VVWLVACAGVAACGGGEEMPAPGTPATVAPPPEAAPQAQAGVESPSIPNETELVREVFVYTSSGRDPFVSLLMSGDVRPLFEDLRVTAINYDPRYPGGSVAVLRDTTLDKRYTVRVGDELGRLRILAILVDEVQVTIEEFGVERQMSLRLRGRQEETQ